MKNFVALVVAAAILGCVRQPAVQPPVAAPAPDVRVEPLSPERQAKLLAALATGREQPMLFRRACHEAWAL